MVIQGDALEVLRRYPDESVDLVFADPPYDLDKAYTTYDDEKDRETYLNWCNAWLDEYIRILKPSGSLYILNLPRWGMYHAAYLNRRLYFQNWIVWDALSEPRGKILPAHYALLFYTKHPTDFTFNYESVGLIDARFYCLRPSCIRQRKARGDDEKERLTDIWWDIHRIKHHHHRDVHPCQSTPGGKLPLLRQPSLLGHAGIYHSDPRSEKILERKLTPILRFSIFTYQAMFQRVGDGLQSVVHAQLMQDVLDVVAGRRLADRERVGDVAGAQTLGEKAEDLAFAPG